MGTRSVEDDGSRSDEVKSVSDLLDSSPIYETGLGAAFQGDSRELLKELPDNSVDLIVTSPPFALQNEKEYGNKDQDSYNNWFMEFIPEVRRVLQPHGSFIVEIGGAFKQGMPERSLYQWKLLTRIVEEGDLEFAQDWYWYNPNKLPSPIEWVNVRKLRGVDAVTQMWWFSKELNKEPAYTDDLQNKIETIELVRDEFGDSLTDDELLDLVKAILYGEAELPEPEISDDETDQTTLNTAAEHEDEVVKQPDDCLSVEYVLDLLAEVSSSDPDTWSAENDLSRADVERVFDVLKPSDDERYDADVRETLSSNISPYWTLYIHSLILGTNKAPRVYGKKVIAHIKHREEIRRPYPKPEVNNQRNSQVLKTYSESQEELIETGEYNEGKRSSGHNIGSDSFSNDNDGAIAKNFIKTPNTASNTHYQRMCRKYGLDRHPARFPEKLPQFFINLLTPDPPYDDWERGYQKSPGYLDRPIVLDIFAGSNWTGKTAEDAGRHWLSFERSEEYIRSSEIRFLEEHELQERLENDDPLNKFRNK